METRAHDMYPVENATIFSFNVESAMPGQILDVRSDSHSISLDIESNTATIEVNEPVLPVSVLPTFDSIHSLIYDEMQGNDDFQLTFFAENLSDTDSVSEGGFTDFSECFHNDDTDVSECHTPIYQDYEASTHGVGVSWCDPVDDQFTGRSFLFAESDDGSDDESDDRSVGKSVDGDQEEIVVGEEERMGEETKEWDERAYEGEEEGENSGEEEFYDCLETVPEQLIAEWARVRDSMTSNGRSSRFTWYDDSDAEEDDVFYFEEEFSLGPRTPRLSIGTFYDSTVVRPNLTPTS